MAFRTNKVPAIEERTVSGSSVSFNSAFALPLKACKVSFMATESGTGEKSPSNPYTISGVSGLNLSANSVPVSVNFGNTRYGGYADLVRKKLVATQTLYQPTINDYISGIVRNGHNCWCFTITTPPPIYKANGNAISNINTAIRYFDTINSGFCVIGNVKPIFALNDSDTGLSSSSSESEIYEAFKTFISTYSPKCVYELATPIEIDLSSIPDLSSIIGNNTFSTDTGTLEITFADLQEKSASGAVATFNTALAMPLVKCEVSFMATQSGSGTPSPYNIRPIVPVSSVDLSANSVSVIVPLGDSYGGGTLDLLTGKANITYGYIILDGSDDEGWFFLYYYRTILPNMKSGNNQYGKCNYLAVAGVDVTTGLPYAIFGVNNNQLYIGNPTLINEGITDLTTFKAYLAEHPIEVVYPLSTPVELSLTPTQIQTLIGNNTIFADTGDIDLTYKDLDLAKRGNFREVFKLPS